MRGKLLGIFGLVVAFFVAFAPFGANAAEFPTRSITLICAWGQGGGADGVARALADATSRHLGQQILVKNVVGGAGTLGVIALTKAKPDGYTIASQTGATVTIAPHLSKDVGFKSPDDFEVLHMIYTQPYIWVVRGESPWKNLNDIIADAKKKPGQITYSFSGVGSGGHLTMEHFSKHIGIKLKIVPFKSAAEGVTNLLGQHVDTSMATPPDVVAHIREGRLRPLGAFNNFRGMETIPALKSWKDQGIDYEMSNWYALVAPKGIPKDVIQKLQSAFKKGMEEKSFVDYMDKIMLSINYMPPEETLKIWKRDYQIMGDMIKELGLSK